MATLTADDLYKLIKKWEHDLPVLPPYVTIDVGRFTPATGTFNGLATTVETDPEPVEHGPNSTPRNPPPRFVGSSWVSVTIDSRWRQTITRVPAPRVSQAPVLLRFSTADPATPWSVTVNGFTASAPAGQATLEVSIWDATIVNWSVQAGARAHRDQLRVQRTAIPAAGAFTIPVLPVGIIYAPPADSLRSSVATYGESEAVGTTVSYDVTSETSRSAPNTDPTFSGVAQFRAGLDALGHVLTLSGNGEAAGTLSIIASEIGTASSTRTLGTVDASGSSLTLTHTSEQSISTNSKNGGPGAGDVIVFYKNVQVAWQYQQGALRLWPFGGRKVLITAAGLKGDLAQIGISAADRQFLLALDPFAAAGPSASLPPDRFTVPDGGIEVTFEYGRGAEWAQKVAKTRDTKHTTTHKTSSTDASTWDPGPVLKMLGIGGTGTQVTTTASNATGDEVESTVTMEMHLASGPTDYFAVTVWFDALFGTWAFQQLPVAAQPILSGSGAKPGDTVKLAAGKKVHMTVADAKGRFAFRAKGIRRGAARLTIGSQSPKPVTVEGASGVGRRRTPERVGPKA